MFSPFRSMELLEDRTVPAVQVVFNYDFDTSGFFADAGRRAVLQQAADAITLQFNDQLSAITPGGGNSWTASFTNPATGGEGTFNNLSVGQNQVVIFAGARNLGGPLGIGGYSAGGRNSQGSSAFLNAIQTRGQGDIFSRNATDFASWGGSIAFDNTTNWSFATSAAGVGSNQSAFYSTALHELGHVFGIGTAQSFENKIRNNQFFGSNVVAANGGAAVPVTGDHGHWAQSVMSDGRQAIMTPSSTTGTFQTFTSVDTAAFADIGWQIGGTPPPGSAPGSAPGPISMANQSRRIFATGTEAGSAPHVKVYDASGVERLSFFAYDAAFRNGVRVATGDVTGDGYDDVAVVPATGGLPQVKVFDGRTGALVQAVFVFDTFSTFGTYIALGDVNNDGRADLIVSSGAGASPLVRVFDGATGQQRTEFFAYDPNYLGGVNVAAGDLNRDGFADIITGTGFGGLGAVREFNGTNNSLMREYFAYPTAFLGGVTVAAGDTDGDGYADVVTTPTTSGGPQVQVFSGRDNSLLRNFLADDASNTSGLRAAVKDLDDDGQAEIAISTGFGQLPIARLFRRSSNNPYSLFFAYDPAFLGGVVVG